MDELKEIRENHSNIICSRCSGLRACLLMAGFNIEYMVSVKECSDFKPMDAVDNVNHPKHYTEGKIECIDYIEDKLTDEEYRGYIKGNVLKYITREKHKNGDEDLRKAKWYLDRLVSRLEESE